MQSLTCDLDYSALTVAAEFTCSMTVAVMAACSVNRLGAGNNGVLLHSILCVYTLIGSSKKVQYVLGLCMCFTL